MFPVTDNPAQRLLGILSEAKDHNENVSIAVWAKIFKFHTNDEVSFYRAIGYLHELVDQVEFMVKEIPDIDTELYLENIPAIRKVITPNGFNSTWSPLREILTNGALTGLKFCAERLGRRHAEVKIEVEKLDAIRKRIDGLMRAVRSSDLDADLKALIYDLLTTIQVSVDSYRAKGANGLKRSITYAVGLLKMHEARIGPEKSKRSIQDLLQFVKDVAVLVQCAYQLKQLSGSVAEFFISNE